MQTATIIVNTAFALGLALGSAVWILL